MSQEEDVVFKSRAESMRYLKKYKQHLRKRADSILKDVLSIEGDLRKPVGYFCEALARNCGHFIATYNGSRVGINVEGVELDADVVDTFCEHFGEEALEDSALWLLDRLKGETATLIAWALGPIRFPEEEATVILENHVVFSMADRDFKAVLTHGQWNHPDCVQHLVNLDGRKH